MGVFSDTLYKLVQKIYSVKEEATQFLFSLKNYTAKFARAKLKSESQSTTALNKAA